MGEPAVVLAVVLSAAAVAVGVPPSPSVRLRRLTGRRTAAMAPGSSRDGPARQSRRRRRDVRPSSLRGRRAWRADLAVPVPILTDLVAAALVTGLPPRIAVTAVADALDAGGGDAGPLRGLDDAFAALGEALELATRTGLTPGLLVLAAADETRRRQAVRRQVAARRLATLVVLPTGLCLLPAFVLLTVAPLVIDLLLH